jgi:hypothetical protein
MADFQLQATGSSEIKPDRNHIYFEPKLGRQLW